MKNILKQNKGISLISLSITVIILVIVVNILLYNAKDSAYVKDLTNMYNDVSNLREKISNYYSIYGDIPAKNKYENEEVINNLKTAGVIGVNDDIKQFYVIELSALDGLTLNFGQDYEDIKNLEVTNQEEQEDINYLTDLYIINKKSHNIFYAQGIEGDNGKYFYTDEKNVDTARLELKYVQGVKIPDGFYYCGGNKQEGIVISDVQGDDLDNTKLGNQYVWIPVDNFEEFIRKDYLGNIENEEFITTEATENKYYENSANGIDEETQIQQMYKSIKINKGFYIARFEAGETVSSKKNQIPKTNVRWGATEQDGTEGAVELSERFATNLGYTSVKSTLCYGVQWDAMMRVLSKGNQLEQDCLTNSTSIGNYKAENKIETGSNSKYQIKNICDLAGNVKEWTMEKYGLTAMVARGGSYKEHGDTNSVASRSVIKNGEGSEDIGYRVALYLITPDDEWSDVYDETGIYTDEDGEQAYIPQGFRVSVSPYQNKINTGLVIKQDSTGNEYVWIRVPKEVLENRVEDEIIEEGLKEYTKEYRQDGYEDTWYQGCGLTQTEYNELKSKMLQSIKKNGGFYIARYESGIENPKTSGNISETADSLQSTNGLPLSQANKYPYNYVTCNQAQKLIQKMQFGNYTGSLMFGIQWDLVCKFIETSKSKTSSQIKEDSSAIGNYFQSGFTLTNGKYSTNNGVVWNTIIQGNSVIKEKNTIALLTTGISKRNYMNNIYDLGGNVKEITLEKSNDVSKAVTYRGGCFEDNASIATRQNGTINDNNYNISYRISIF